MTDEFNAKTNWFESAIQDWAFNGVDLPSAASTVEVGLHVGDPSNSGEQNEVNTVDYERASVSIANFNTTGNNPRVATNTQAILFDSAETNWGTITHCTLWHPGQNEPLYWGEFDVHRTVNTGEIYEIEAGELVVRDF